jgi:uncharacterized protein
MPNHLAQQTSPYLLQHAGQPVDWFPWNEQALEKARAENKPIFLSIGYAACHWCHVMAHESFADPAIAEFLNQHFISIKVDREERPDLDSVYMSSVVAMTGQGGWPMSLFLTPDGRPFYGGTYYPPLPRYGLPSFRQVIESIAGSWKDNREQIERIGSQIADHLQKNIQTALPPQPLQPEILSLAAQVLSEQFDWATGGWGTAPKFPQPMSIDFLLGQATRTPDSTALQVATRSLDAMMAGGMYDLIGGGFHRYSTDANWLVPHFEKMLYDNAQLALTYLHAYQLTGNEAYRRVCEDTLDFIARELSDKEGGFYSSLDADSEGREGSYYIWSVDDFEKAIPDPDLRGGALSAYGVTAVGNFEGQSILRLSQSKNGQDDENRRSILSTEQLDQVRRTLFAFRQKRVRPATDDKVITGWNALALRAFSEAAAVLQNHPYLDVATRNAHFLLDHMRPEGRLIRSWRHSQGRQTAFLEDYAGLILGLLALYQADPQPVWFEEALNLHADMLAQFSDPQGGFFDTPFDQPTPLSRPKDLQDNATPSGNALAALALLKLAEFTGQADLRDRAESMLGPLQSTAVRYPSSFAFWLQALDYAVGPVQQVALIGEPASPEMTNLLRAFHQTYRPRTVLAFSAAPPSRGSPPLLADRPMLHGQPTAYVCQGFVCRLPVTGVEAFKQALDAA